MYLICQLNKFIVREAYCITGLEDRLRIKHPSVHNICSAFDLYDEKTSIRVVKKRSCRFIDYGEILVRDLETDTVLEYKSVEILADILNVEIKDIKQVIRSKHIFKNRYRIAPKSDLDLSVYKKTKRIQLTNIVTGESVIKNSRKETARFLEVTPPQISYLLKHNTIFRNTWKLEKIDG